jgi:putative phosphoribosyl transferase
MGAQLNSVRIISSDSDPFSDRQAAGMLLAAQLLSYRDSSPVVLGIPRGGAIIAVEIARVLKAGLDIVLAHKLGAPHNSELAIGSVCEDGTLFIEKEIAIYAGADNRYIQQEKKRQLREIGRKVKLYRKILPRISLAERVVIITDDGVATGATMQAAFWAVRNEKPKKIVLALPVGPVETITRLAGATDETVCLKTPPYFHAIGQFYEQFPQVEDEELLEVLELENKRRNTG